MGILRTLGKFGNAAVRAASVLYVVLCLCWSSEICLCDPDPDNCGEHCHECDGHSAEECLHFSVDVDDFLAPQTVVSLPAVPPAIFPEPSLAVSAVPARPRERPSSTAPPDGGGGRYVSYSKRLHPLA
jgi:hypothetical protein